MTCFVRAINLTARRAAYALGLLTLLTAHVAVAQTALDPASPAETDAGFASQMGMAAVLPADKVDPNLLLIAHPSWPVQGQVQITSLATGRAVTAWVGSSTIGLSSSEPYVAALSASTAAALGLQGDKPEPVLLRWIGMSVAAAANPGRVPAASATAARPVQTALPLESPAVAAPLPQLPGIDSGLYLQLGAFRSADAAWSLFGKMRKVLGNQGPKLEVLQTGDVHRVRVGPFDEKTARNAARAKLEAAAGFKLVEVAQ